MLEDALTDVKYRSYVPEDTNRYFRLPTVFSKKGGFFDEEKLYLCYLSEFLALKNRYSSVFFCIDDVHSPDAVPEGTDNIVVLDTDMPFVELFTLLQDVFYKVLFWSDQMKRVIIGGGGIQELVTLSEPVLGNTVNITDSSMSLLAHTYGIETDDAITLELVKNGFHSDKMIDAMKSVNCFDTWEKEDLTIFVPEIELCKYIMVSRIFRHRGTYFAHAVLVCDVHPMTRGLVDMFKLLLDEIENCIRRTMLGDDFPESGYERLLTEFTDGKVFPTNIEKDLAERVNIPQSERYHLLILRQENPLSVQISRMKLELSDILPKCCIWTYRGDLLVLDPTLREMEALHKSEAFLAFLRRYGAYCAVSNYFSRLSGLNRAYQKAMAIMQHRKEIMHTRYVPDENYSRVLYFDGCLLPCLLADCGERIADLWTDSGYARFLRKIDEYDKAHNTDNLELLRTYLHFERKATQTSEEMNLHRNTVLYRIDKIQELMGLDLDDPRVRLNLTVSLTLWDLLDKEK